MDSLLKVLDFAKDSGVAHAKSSAAQGDHHDFIHGAGLPGKSSTPGPLPSALVHSEQSARHLSANHAKAVRLLWCDTAGIRRCRVVSGRRYGALHTTGLGITTACMAMPGYADAPAPNAGLSAVGEARIKPVDMTRVAIPWSPSHQMALVEFEAPHSETPWECCPRRALRYTCEMLQDKFGLTLKVGFEIEFVLLEQHSGVDLLCPSLFNCGWQPVDRALYCQSSALNRQAEMLDEMVEALEAMGIEVVQWHPESAPGQFEISLVHSDPVDSADKLLMAKEVLVGVAARHRRGVSFLPKLYPDAAGNGLHVHYSLWKDGKCVMYDTAGPSITTGNNTLAGAVNPVIAADCPPLPSPHQQPPDHPHPPTSDPSNRNPNPAQGVPEAPAPDAPSTQPLNSQPQPTSPRPSPSLEMLSFLAGVLSYLEVLLPFTAPSPNSYERLRPGAWAGAHSAWGYDNREVPLRVTAPGPNQLDKMHVEYKALDGTANPYLALSAIMVAGMLGLSARLVPPEPCQVAPSELDSEAAARLGVRALPGSLREALDLLESTQTGEVFKSAMAEAISQPLLKAFLAVREAEAQQAPKDQPVDMLFRYS